MFARTNALSVFSCGLPTFPGFVNSRKIVSTLGGIFPMGLSCAAAILGFPTANKTTRASIVPVIFFMVDLLGQTHRLNIETVVLPLEHSALYTVSSLRGCARQFWNLLDPGSRSSTTTTTSGSTFIWFILEKTTARLRQIRPL